MTPRPTPYVPLWCKSYFSFLEGASSPAELMAEAGRLGIRKLALTDRDGLYGVVRANKAGRAAGVDLIVGAQVTIDDGSHIQLLATDGTGYKNLCRLLSLGRLRAPKGSSLVGWEDVEEQADGLIAVWGGLGSRLLAPAPPDDVAERLTGAFGDRLYAMVTRHLLLEEAEAEARLLARARRYGLPVVAAIETLYHEPSRRPLQDVVTGIRHGVTLQAAGRLLKANAEHALLPPDAFAARFADLPEAVARTAELGERCTFDLKSLRYRYPSEALSEGESAGARLHRLTREGAARHWPEGVPEDVAALLAKELALIDHLDFAGYFLTMHDLVAYCKRNDILCQGRGSAANSVVCYCLGITAVAPGRINVLFERFISIERAEPPDIDLDIEHQRREEVIQHVYEHYGRNKAAMVAVVIAYRTRSAVRDVAKVLGLPETEIGRLSKLVGHWGGLTPEVLRLADLDPEAPGHVRLMALVDGLRDFPRHLSIHPGGFLLGHEPVHDLVPIENGTMDGRTVIQWEKDDVEEMGLFKVDLLGLGALSQLRRCFKLVEEARGLKYSMTSFPEDDDATYEMLAKGDTVGLFQVESRAQMAMLPRLRPKNYYDIVVQISIVRPGPISGGMVHPYLARRAKREPIEYPHPCMKEALERTLGVPLFQEQVMKIAMVAADYTPGEADQLRRDMGAWRQKGRLESHRERLITRMIAKGVAPEFAERIFKQIQGFGEYGFPEAHAASFALITYVGSYLRRHHLPEFTCALLNALPMGFYSGATIVQDAKRHGVTILPIDIDRSAWDCTLEPDPGPWGFAVRMGFRLVEGLAEADGAAIAAQPRPFGSIAEAVLRTGLGEQPLAFLAEAGAFDRYARRRAALWEVRGEARGGRQPLKLATEPEAVAFAPLTLFECINWDYERAGHSPLGHPLGPIRHQLAAQGLPTARWIGTRARDGERVRYAGVVICRQRPGTAKDVTFMTLEDETGFVNLVVWPQIFKQHTLVARTVAFLGVTGRIQRKDGVVHLIAAKLWRPDIDPGLAAIGSRDFH